LFTTADIILFPLYLVIFLIIIRKSRFFKDSDLPGYWFTGVFLMKVAAGTFLAFIYTYYYSDRQTADIYKYFDDSRIMYDALWNKPADFFRMLFGVENDNQYFNTEYYNHMNNWFRKYESNIYNDSHTIIRLNALIRIFSFGSYHVHTLFACFLSLAGLTAIFHAVKKMASDRIIPVAIGIFLFPSLIFWGSGVLKEAFLLFGLGFLVKGFFELTERNFSAKGIILATIGIVMLLYLKVYVLMALLPGMIAYFWVHYTDHRKAIAKYLIVILLTVFAGAGFHYLFPDYKILYILEQKQEDFLNLARAMNSGSIIYSIDLEPEFWSFLKAAPLAFFNVMFRPFFGESFSPFLILASIENAFVLIGIYYIISYFRKPAGSVKNLVLLSLTFVILLFILIGWVTPVMGAIVRYKVPALPFLGIAIVMLISKEKFRYKNLVRRS
jgi:hypothetical protein